MRRFMRAMALGALSILIVGSALAQTRPAVREIPAPGAAIYIGNSFFYYYNGIHGHVGQLRTAAGLRPFRSVLVGICGSGFDWHDVNGYFRTNALARYSFDRNNDVVLNPPRTPLFDVAIMMDCSQCPIHPALEHDPSAWMDLVL